MGDPETGETVSIRARFQAGLLMVTDVDRRFPSPGERRGLLPYMANLSDRGWKAARASFDGFDITIEFEHSDSGAIRFYTVQVVQSTPMFVPQKGLLNELHAPLIKYGWRQLAHSAPLDDMYSGVSMVSFWMKEIPGLNVWH